MSDFGRLMELARQHVPEPANVDVPAVMPMSGNVGDTLTCTSGNWTGEPSSYAYSWMSDATDVVGAGDTYVIAPADPGHSLTCVVTATNVVGSVVAPPSNAVAVPAAGGMTRAATPNRTEGRRESANHEGRHERR